MYKVYRILTKIWSCQFSNSKYICVRRPSSSTTTLVGLLQFMIFIWAATSAIMVPCPFAGKWAACEWLAIWRAGFLSPWVPSMIAWSFLISLRSRRPWPPMMLPSLARFFHSVWGWATTFIRFQWVLIPMFFWSFPVLLLCPSNRRWGMRVRLSFMISLL